MKQKIEELASKFNSKIIEFYPKGIHREPCFGFHIGNNSPLTVQSLAIEMEINSPKIDSFENGLVAYWKDLV